MTGGEVPGAALVTPTLLSSPGMLREKIEVTSYVSGSLLTPLVMSMEKGDLLSSLSLLLGLCRVGLHQVFAQ